jgi:hypothetical protein
MGNSFSRIAIAVRSGFANTPLPLFPTGTLRERLPLDFARGKRSGNGERGVGKIANGLGLLYITLYYLERSILQCTTLVYYKNERKLPIEIPKTGLIATNLVSKGFLDEREFT